MSCLRDYRRSPSPSAARRPVGTSLFCNSVQLAVAGWSAVSFSASAVVPPCAPEPLPPPVLPMRASDPALCSVCRARFTHRLTLEAHLVSRCDPARNGVITSTSLAPHGLSPSDVHRCLLSPFSTTGRGLLVRKHVYPPPPPPGTPTSAPWRAEPGEAEMHLPPQTHDSVPPVAAHASESSDTPSGISTEVEE